jgi:hypothetical protein
MQKILPSIAENRIERRASTLFNPATGTKIITPEFDRKIRKAFGGAARHTVIEDDDNAGAIP